MQPYHFRCPQCGARNRIPVDKIGLTGTCGKCKSPLDTTALKVATPVVASDRNFAETVLHAPLPVLLDCWAPWCGPCQMIGPVLDQLAKEWQGRVRVAKLNIDENPATAATYSIRSVPTMMIFERGELRDTMVGAVPKPQLQQKMAPYL